MRDFHLSGWQDVLTSQIYVEGFGEGAYSRLDARLYQGLTTTRDAGEPALRAAALRIQLLRRARCLGGRFSADINAFNVLREVGTNTQRAGGSANWERPFTGQLGDLWKITMHLDAASYVAHDLNQQPNFSTVANAATARAEPHGGADGALAAAAHGEHWARSSSSRSCRSSAARTPATSGAHTYIPNEDSLDFEFTDANLFALNRYPGIDRLGGRPARQCRAAHATGTGAAAIFDGLIGQSYREHKDDTFPVGSGLEDNVSDIVARGTIAPASWLDLTSRFRLDKGNLNVHFAEGVASVGAPIFRVNGGYIYSNVDPYYLYTAATPPRNISRRATKSRSAPPAISITGTSRPTAGAICRTAR